MSPPLLTLSGCFTVQHLTVPLATHCGLSRTAERTGNQLLSYGLSPSAKKTLPALCGFSDHKTQTGNHDGCREGSKQTQPSFLKRHQQRHNNRCRKFNRLKQAERVILNDQGVQDGTRQLPLTITAFKAKNDESGLSLNSRPDTILKPYKLTLLSLPFFFF